MKSCVELVLKKRGEVMKQYVKPKIEYIYLRAEESIASCPPGYCHENGVLTYMGLGS